MLKAYKYRIYPTNEQKEQISLSLIKKAFLRN